MSRYHILDTHTGAIVQESNWLPAEQPKQPYKRPQLRTGPYYRQPALYQTPEGRLAIVGFSCLILGMTLG